LPENASYYYSAGGPDPPNGTICSVFNSSQNCVVCIYSNFLSPFSNLGMLKDIILSVRCVVFFMLETKYLWIPFSYDGLSVPFNMLCLNVGVFGYTTESMISIGFTTVHKPWERGV
jgi:hypothetical protein